VLSEWLGFSNALLMAGGISVLGFIFFLLEKQKFASQSY
jgi:hypothetical protein